MGAGAATAAEPIAFGQNPAAMRTPERGILEAGVQFDFHRPYGLEELQVSDAGGYCGSYRGGLGVSWRETEVADLFRERALAFNPVLRLGSARSRFPGQLDVGGNWTLWRTEITGDEVKWNGSQGLGMVWRLLPRLKLGGYALGLPWPGSGSPIDPVWQWGLEAMSREVKPSGQTSGRNRPGPAQTLHLDFRKTGNMPWHVLGSLSLSLHPSLQVSAGLSTPPFQIAFGLRVGWGGLEWNQSLRYHRYLGRTSLSGLAYAHDFGP